MKSQNLSDRAAAILYCIAQRSDDGRSWLPASGNAFKHSLSDRVDGYRNVYLNISGSGDARILNSLRDKGMLGRRRDWEGGYNWLFATDTGRRWLADNEGRVDTIFRGLEKDAKLRFEPKEEVQS